MRALLPLALAIEAGVAALLGAGAYLAAGVLHCLAWSLLLLAPVDGAGPALRLLRVTLPALGPAAALAALLVVLLPAAPVPRAARGAAGAEDPMADRLAAVEGAPGAPEGFRVEALADVVRWGTPAQQQRALELAAEGLRPGELAVLRLALTGPSETARAAAQRVLPLVEKGLARDAGARSQEDQRAFARWLDEATHAGVLPAATAETWRRGAAALWHAEVRRAPRDAEAQAALGRDLLALDEVQAARRALESALGAGAESPALVNWLAECLYRLGDWPALDALVFRFREVLEAEAAAGGPIAPALSIWLADTRPALRA